MSGVVMARNQRLSKLVMFGEASLRRTLTEFLRHYHFERNHQGKENILLFPALHRHVSKVLLPVRPAYADY